MSLFESIKQGLLSLKANGLRAIITCLIIAIGIAALVGILTAIDGMKNAVSGAFSKMGSQSFLISNSASLRSRRSSETTVDYKPLRLNEALNFQRQFNYPAKLSIHQFAAGTAKVRYNGKETNPNIAVQGVDENYIDITGYSVSTGRNFTANDVALSLPLAVIGKEVALKLFGSKTAVGEEILMDGKRYKVVGVLNEMGSTLGRSGGDRIVFIPLNRIQTDYSKIEDNVNIDVRVDKVEDLEPAMDEAYFVLRRVRGLKVRDPDNFRLEKSDAMAQEAVDSMGNVTAVGTIIAIITLLGAAISLMNIMLVSVTERTREIGIRKALGSSADAIKRQFLIEAVVICQIGGIGGIVLGMAIGNGVSLALGSGFIIPWLWMFVSMIVCTAVGLAAGIYPAIKAASMDPIEALRYE